MNNYYDNRQFWFMVGFWSGVCAVLIAAIVASNVWVIFY